MMKRLILLVFTLLIIGMLPVTAQESCDVAAANATAILDTALILLQGGNTAGATTLITSARDSLATCVPSGDSSSPDTSGTTIVATVVPTSQPDTPSEAPTETAATPADTASSSDSAGLGTTGIGDYTLVQPEVSIDSGIAFVRFAHTSVDMGTIDLYRDNETQPIVAGFDYGEVTELIPLPAGGHLFVARPAGVGAGGPVLKQMRWNFASNSSWVVVVGGVEDTTSTGFRIEPIAIFRGDYNEQARVRIVNFAAGAPRINITTVQGLVLGDGLGWVDLRDDMLTPGEYIIDGEATNGEKFVTPQPFTFAANITYTLLVMGGGNDQPLSILAFETPEEISRVRFINNRIDVLDVHYRPGNQLLIANFDPQTETDWFEFPSGAVTFVAVEPGAGPFGREKAALPWQLRPGRDIVIEINQNGMRVVDVSLRGYQN